MKSVMISIRPEWCEKIANGKKTIEVRKSKPKLETPFKCYIYCAQRPPYLVFGDVFRGSWEAEYTTTQGYSREEANRIWGTMNGKVIGEFICNEIERYIADDFCYGAYYISDDEITAACLPVSELWKYGKGKTLYGWYISDLLLYDPPQDLDTFKVRETNEIWSFTRKLAKAPQSWCYVEEI